MFAVSGSGGGRGEAIRNIYYSDRQLPLGHDPCAVSGEAPTGRQRGSRPLDILVECRGRLRPRREVRTRHDDPTILTLSATAKAPPHQMSPRVGLGSTAAVVTAAAAKPRGDAVAAVTSVTAAAPTVASVPPRVRDESSPGHGGRGGHGGPCPQGR
jgi:hypothetical protein